MDHFETVYYDKTVLINDVYIKIFKYYIPLATSKTVFFNQISYIIYHRDRSIDVLWGASSDKLKDWFPFDEKRKQKKGYFEIVLKDRSIRPCFSPIDPERVFNIIWTNHSVQGKIWKQQALRSMQPVILLSSREEEIKNSQKSHEVRILFDPKCPETINQDDIVIHARQLNEKQREPFKELTNCSLVQQRKISESIQERFTPVKYLEFEEESIEGYSSSKKENNELIEENEFEQLS